MSAPDGTPPSLTTSTVATHLDCDCRDPECGYAHGSNRTGWIPSLTWEKLRARIDELSRDLLQSRAQTAVATRALADARARVEALPRWDMFYSEPDSAFMCDDPDGEYLSRAAVLAAMEGPNA